ncbi:MAG: hypothetical protein HRU19_28345 [Pseudobacteriovorax sp.]|nr:hypothetical protein [Pseudobacteriovorax sp.]
MTTLEFHDFILDNDIIGFFEEPLTLKSGRKSSFYVNWRHTTNDAYLLDQLTDHVAQFISQSDIDFTSLIGVPEGASKTAVITALKIAKLDPKFAKNSHVISMGRAKPKSHGAPEDKYFIGCPQGSTYVLEDTVTTGLSLITFVDQLIKTGIDVKGVIALTDRGETRDDGLSVEDYLKTTYKGNISYHPLSRARDLIPLALEKMTDRGKAEALREAIASESITENIEL